MPAQPPFLCPICKKPTEFFAEPLGPFCSPRCKLVDLGKWLGAEYQISEPLRPEHFSQYEELAEDAGLDEPDEDGEARRRGERS